MASGGELVWWVHSGVPLFPLTPLDLAQIPLRMAHTPQAGQRGHPPKPGCQASTHTKARREALRTGARGGLNSTAERMLLGGGLETAANTAWLISRLRLPAAARGAAGAGGQWLAAPRGSLTCLRPPKGR